MSLCEPTDPDDTAGRFNYACQTGSLERVKQVVQECHITNFDLLDQYGSPPLYNAAMKSDNAQLIEYLLDNGATVGLRNSENETPLFIAVFNNHLDVVKKLVERDGKIEEKGGVYGDTPLHVCVKNNLSTMMNLVISYNVNVNARNDAGETALWLACKLDRKLLAYTLLLNKANKSLQADGKDCLYIASEKRNLDVVKLLKAEGPAELMRIKQSFGPARSSSLKKPSSNWREIAFKQELDNLGISEENAARKPRALPKAERQRRKTGPLPLFDSDEDDDEREERLRKEEEARPKPQVLRYQDPEGTTYNPTGALHLEDVLHTKAMHREHQASSGERKPAPPPGLIDADDNSWATGIRPQAAASTPSKANTAGSNASPLSAGAKQSAGLSGKPSSTTTTTTTITRGAAASAPAAEDKKATTLPRHAAAAAAASPGAASFASTAPSAAAKGRSTSTSRKPAVPKRDTSRKRTSLR